jgi:hypothetical protein
MLRFTAPLLVLLLLSSLACLPTTAQTPDAETQIAHAVLPAPDTLRAEATVLGYADDGTLTPLREGTNDLICLTDQPGDDRFHASCYHSSLEPYMQRGRELRAQGQGGQESIQTRHAEAEAGTLTMPDEPAVVYNVSYDLETFDPETARVTLYAIYIPNATTTTTGLPEKPGPPGTPWLMRAGTPSAHIMVIPPPSGNDEN